MVVPQVRPRCTHWEEAAAAEAGGAPREVSEPARGLPGCSRTGRSRAPLGRVPVARAAGTARAWRAAGPQTGRAGGCWGAPRRAAVAIPPGAGGGAPGAGWGALWLSDPARVERPRRVGVRDSRPGWGLLGGVAVCVRELRRVGLRSYGRVGNPLLHPLPRNA